MVYLRSKSEIMKFERRENLKYRFDNMHLCKKEYYVIIVGLNTAII